MSSMHLLKRFDRAQLFRFFVDGRFHRKSKYDGWVGYEAREKGSVQAMLDGFALMIERFHESPRCNGAYLRELHRVCLLHVATNNDKSSPGELRYHETGLPLFVKTTTRESVAELIEMRKGDGTAVFHDRELASRRAEALDADEVFALLQKKGKLLYRGWYPNLDPATAKALSAPGSLREFYGAKHRVQMALAERMDTIIEKYHRDMKAAGAAERLPLIARLVRELEVLHPFPDGNCRVFAGVLLNQLLLWHGMAPTIVRNPNFDFEHSLAQWSAEIEEGMAHTRTLLEDPQAVVFDYSIREMREEDRARFLEMARELCRRIDAYSELFLTPRRLREYTGGRWVGPEPETCYSGIGTHGSFQAGDLYFALDLRQWIEEGRDVRAELGRRVKAGVRSIVLDDERYAEGLGIPALVVADAMEAFTRAASRTREEANPKTVLVTGTEGKTGAKIQLHHLLAPQAAVHAWLSSANTVVPILKSLASLEPWHGVELNEVSVDADTAKTAERSRAVGPDICFFSNVSLEHMHVHGSVAGVVRHKSFAVAGLRPGGKCVVGSGMETFSALVGEIRARRPDAHILTYGVDASDAARLVAARFDAASLGWHVEADILGEAARYFVPLVQSHAPLMSVGVMLVVRLLGYDLARAAAAWGDFQPYESMGRLHRVALDGGDLLFYDQSRRASLSGVRSVFRDLARIEVPGKIVALYGNVSSTKDNEWTRAYHEELARLIGASRIKRLYTSGPGMEELAGKLADPSVFVLHSNDHGLLYDEIMSDVAPGDLLLIQGYLRLNLEEIARRVLDPAERASLCGRLLSRFFERASGEEVHRLGHAIRAGAAEALPQGADAGIAAGLRSGKITYRTFRARLLQRFFARLDAHVEATYGLRCINRDMERSGYGGTVHQAAHCDAWFNNIDRIEGQPRKILFGSYFDFGDPRYLLQILVGTTDLHVGLLKYERRADKLAIRPMGEEDYRAVEARFNPKLQGIALERRNWGHKWLTVGCGNFIDVADPHICAAMFDFPAAETYRRCCAPLLDLLKNK